MKQSDALILRELQAIGAALGAGGGSGGGGGGAIALALALEEQTEGSNWLGMLRKAGSQIDGNPNRIITQRYSPDRMLVSTSLSSGAVRMAALYLAKEKLITGGKWYQATAGTGFTPNNSNHIGLYSYVPGENFITQRAVSASNDALWSATPIARYGNANFVTPYLAPPGIYYTAFLFNGTGGTAPGLGSFSIMQSEQCGDHATLFANANFNLVANVPAQTSLAASYLLSALTKATITGYQTWSAIY